MARVMIAESILQDVANAIRTASSSSETMRPIDFANKILNLSGDASSYVCAETYVSSSTLDNDKVDKEKLTYAYFPYATSMDSNLFSGYSKLVAISAPSLATLPMYFLQSCNQLASASFPAVTRVENYAFQSCYQLSRIDLPSCTDVSYEAFMSFSGDIHFAAANESTIKKTDWYQNMGEGYSRAYFDLYASESGSSGGGSVYCSEESEVTNETMTDEGYDESSRTSIKYAFLPNATTLGDEMFRSCEQLTQIYLPKVTSLNEKSIYSLVNLAEVHLPYASKETIENNFPLSIVDGKEVREVKFGNATTYFDLYAGDAESYTFTSDAIHISPNFSDYDQKITSASLPSCQYVEDYAFSNCSGLTSIELPQATTIGNSAFLGCTGLTSIELPQATTIGNYAFSNCTGLTSISLPQATTIGDAIFGGCRNITSVTLGIETLGGELSALRDAQSGLVLNLPKCSSITSKYAFSGFSNNLQVHFAAANQSAIEACDGYSDNFGGSSVTFYFDL